MAILENIATAEETVDAMIAQAHEEALSIAKDAESAAARVLSAPALEEREKAQALALVREKDIASLKEKSARETAEALASDRASAKDHEDEAVKFLVKEACGA